MGINNLPSSLQSIIQQNFLQREWQEALKARMGFREIATRELFMAGVGETITKTRPGLIGPKTTPLPPAANTDITSGMTSNTYAVEQYTLAINQYADQFLLNVVTSRVAIQDQFLMNARQLAYGAALTLDSLALQALYAGYMGGNTRVTTTLGAAGTVVHVDDIRGFQYTFNAEGQTVSVSSSNPVNVTVGSDVYSLVGAAADGTNTSTAAIAGGISGNLTFSASVTVADGTAGNAVVSVVAPSIIRPGTGADTGSVATTAAITSSLYNGGKPTLQMLINAVAQLRANAVPEPRNGYKYFCDPQQLTGFYTDTAFQQFFRGRVDTAEYRRGLISDAVGCEIITTNINPIQASLGYGLIHRGILCGEGALIEGEYTTAGYAGAVAGGDEDMIEVVDGIAHVIREPLDALKQVVTQSYAYIGGFVAPTDMTANPTTVPTASNANLKRAVLIESL